MIRLIIAVVVLSLIVMLLYSINTSRIQKMNVSINSKPYSADPLDYDYSAHHFAFRSIHSNLVSVYPKLGVKGILADSWRVNNLQTEWIFKIRNDLKYSNGDSIRAEDIIKSLKRTILVLKQKKSKVFLTTNLVNVDKFNSINDNFEGISLLNQNEVIFRLKEPMQNFLENLSFGLYAITHEKNWETKDLTWVADKTPITTGPYQIESWDEEHLRLKLRSNFPSELYANKATQIINIAWKNYPDPNANVIIGSSNLKLNNKQFFGPVPSGIFFIRVLPFMDKNHSLSHLNNRINLRNLFYKNLFEDTQQNSISFFPTAIKGVANIPYDTSADSIDVSKITNGITIRRPSIMDPVTTRYIDSLEKTCHMLKISCKFIEMSGPELMYSIGNPHEYKADLAIIFTTILVNSPDDDIRFMFQSSEGIQIPDLTGEVNLELNKKSLDYQKINNLIFSQAVIWPLGHFSLGVWADKNIDLSSYNLVQPPIDYSWLSVK